MNLPSSSNKAMLKLVFCAASLALLTACGGATDEQDAPTIAVDTRITLSGVTMNGYLANALVWVDARQNNTLDGFEPFAYTDNQGFFSYNPNTGVDYCASNQASEQRFCLQTPTQSGTLVIKAAKGIELLSGETFRSVLTSTIDAELAKQNFASMQALGAKPEGNSAAWQSQIDTVQLKLSPLSSVAYYLPNGTDLSAILLSLGFNVPADTSQADILNKEYIAGLELEDSLSPELFAAAVTLSRLVDTITVNLDEATKNADFGENGLPISSADAVYQGLAQSLASRSTATVTSRANTKTQAINDIFPASDLLANAVLNLVGLLSDNNASSSALQNTINTVAQNENLQSLLNSIGNIGVNHFANVDPSGDVLSQLLTFNQSLTLPTLSAPVAFANAREALGITTLSTFLQDPDNRISALLSQATQSFVDNRGDDAALTLSVDLNTLSQTLLDIAEQATGEADLASQDVPVTLPQLAQVETVDKSSFWASKRLSLSGLQDGDEQGQVVMFFEGDSSASSGALIMCIAYINDADPSDNITNQRFNGTWSVISGNSQNRLSLVSEGFNIQMKVLGESLGADIPDEEQIASLSRLPNETYGRFGFTINEDTATWYSDDASVNQSFGLNAINDIPNDDSACATLLSL